MKSSNLGLAVGFETSSDFELLLDYFYKKTGIFFSEKRSIIAGRIEDFFGEHGFKDRSSYVDILLNNKEMDQKLVNLLTVNETYFFRESKAIDIFADFAKKSSGRFRVLCMPCSTGEEPYSLAIALYELGVTPDRYEIVGIDINSAVIEEARKGVYRKRSVYRTSDQIRDRYFDMDGEFVSVKPMVKKGVRFEVCNIFDDCLRQLGSFEFVFCRNLLIYFDQESRSRAERQIYKMVRDGGYAFTGHADLISNDVGFKKHFDQGTLYYQK